MAELEPQEYWWRKLWWLAEAKPIQYFSSQDLTTFWRIKLWRIGNEPPIRQSFIPPKFCAIRYYKTLHLNDIPFCIYKTLQNYVTLVVYMYTNIIFIRDALKHQTGSYLDTSTSANCMHREYLQNYLQFIS